MSATPSNLIPLKSKVLVIGAGPGGSYAATVLAREGFEVTIFERDVFPRYHIGESLLPSCRPFLRFIEAEELIKKHGFADKPGAAVKLNQHKREGYTDFIATTRITDRGTFVAFRSPKCNLNQVRSEFDEILLRHAGKCGVTVCEGVKVKSLTWDDTRPVSAEWEAKDGGEGSTAFDYIIDAWGKQGIISTRYLHNRNFNKSLRNVACWGYYRGASMYAPEGHSERNNAPYFEALTDESGWAWFIPLHNGTVSVGVVLTEEASIAKKRAVAGEGNALRAHYLQQLRLAPNLTGLIAGGELVSDIKSAGDYSYSATSYAGPYYRLVGDAACFIDPFFSSGVHLALTGALSAASSVAASIRNQCTETEAAAFHDAKVGTSYTRFLLVILGVYKQIKAQESPVFSDIDEDNFDRAFHFLRPIIQGAADADPKMTEEELQGTMDFCQGVFAPTDSTMVSKVEKKLGPTALAVDAPIMSVASVMALAGNDEDARNVLLKVNARKPLAEMYGCNTAEVMGGFYVRMERGALGLVRA
ncbi:putative halogenase [Mycena polygramma]|nr:putative halogenase [Mycena polygramma]